MADLVRVQGFAPEAVMVLSRRREMLSHVADALAALGVPHALAEPLKLNETPAALDLVALLDALASPTLDLPFARALKSPLFGADDGDLLWLSRQARGRRKDTIAIVVLAIAIFALIFKYQFPKVDLTAVFTTSAIFGVILGLALQDTLGNLFSGISLQADKPFAVGDGRLVAEHVDIERTSSPGTHCGDHLLSRLGVNRPNPNGAEPTGVRHRGGHFRCGHARHRGLDDRQLDADLAEKWVHRALRRAR